MLSALVERLRAWVGAVLGCFSADSSQLCIMATYVYESIPGSVDEPVERFEIRQSMMDDALDAHPDTGTPIRRVITGGYLSTGGGTTPASGAGGC